MQPSRTSPENQLWTMKDAAKEVGVGLPRLYARLREKGLFTRLGQDGRHIPCKQLRDERLFLVFASSYYPPGYSTPKPCPKVKATFQGLMLLQEIADELEREREKPADKRPGVRSEGDGDQRKGALAGEQPVAPAAGGTEQQAGSDGVLREPSPAASVSTAPGGNHQ